MTSRRVAFVATLATAIAAPLGAQTFSPERVKADISFLADDKLEGRNTGTRGYDLAALYVANRFASLGLKPGNGDSWYQIVPFIAATPMADRANAITFGGQSFANGVDVATGGSFEPADFTTEAEAVFVGYGLENKQYGFDDYRGLDVAGKIVVYLSSMPAGMPSDVRADLASRRAELAQAKGAIGALSILTPESLALRSWDRRRESASEQRLRWAASDGQGYSRTPKLSVGGTLGPKASDALLRGTPLTLDRLNAMLTDKKAMPRGFALPGKIKFERHNKIDRVTSPNVLGLLPGSDPVLANEVVMLTAHLDHDGIVAGKSGDAIMNGAMDNAAGVSTMLEAARAFIDSGKAPRRSVLFVALTAEEDGLLGADYLANHPVLKGKKIVGNVNLDMPVLTYDFQDVVAFGAEHSTMGPAVARAVAKAGIRLSPDPMPEEGLFTRSDHYRFVQQGIPSVFLVTGFAGPGKEAFQSFLKNHYHRVSDQPTLPFNWKAGAKFARVNYLIARELADAPQAPRWYQGSFFGDVYAKNAPRAKRP